MWWSRSVAVAFPPYLNTGAETSSAGKTTCSAPHTNPRCAAVANGPESPADARRPRTPPQPVPYPQWTRLENRPSDSSSFGSTSSTASAASAGVWLAPRPLSFISSVLDTVIAAVPARPANNPLPKFAAMSPRLTPIGYSLRVVRDPHHASNRNAALGRVRAGRIEADCLTNLVPVRGPAVTALLPFAGENGPKDAGLLSRSARIGGCSSMLSAGHPRSRPGKPSCLSSADYQHLERARTVHALDPVELDVRGRRRAGDEGDGASFGLYRLF